jgi:hypothetical protein
VNNSRLTKKVTSRSNGNSHRYRKHKNVAVHDPTHTPDSIAAKIENFLQTFLSLLMIIFLMFLKDTVYTQLYVIEEYSRVSDQVFK